MYGVLAGTLGFTIIVAAWFGRSVPDDLRGMFGVIGCAIVVLSFSAFERR
jgi:hypothetical protein